MRSPLRPPTAGWTLRWAGKLILLRHTFSNNTHLHVFPCRPFTGPCTTCWHILAAVRSELCFFDSSFTLYYLSLPPPSVTLITGQAAHLTVLAEFCVWANMCDCVKKKGGWGEPSLLFCLFQENKRTTRWASHVVCLVSPDQMVDSSESPSSFWTTRSLC